MKILFKNNTNGLTLIEIMVAISKMSFSFISIMYAFPFGTAINKRANSATTASHLAQQKVEELRSLGYDNIIVGTVESKTRLSLNSSSYLYHFQREASVDYVDSNLDDSVADLGIKKISTTVYYDDAISKAEKGYSIVTLISQR